MCLRFDYDGKGLARIHLHRRRARGFARSTMSVQLMFVLESEHPSGNLVFPFALRVEKINALRSAGAIDPNRNNLFDRFHTRPAYTRRGLGGGRRVQRRARRLRHRAGTSNRPHFSLHLLGDGLNNICPRSRSLGN